MVTDALLSWLVVYAGLFAIIGFLLVVVRSASDRRWSDRDILRASSAVAFVTSAAVWLLVLLPG